MAEVLCELKDVLMEGDMSEEDAGSDASNVLTDYISAFSSAIVQYCSFSFESKTITDIEVMAPSIMIGMDGSLYAFLRYANIRSVASFQWRMTPLVPYETIDTERVLCFPAEDVNEMSGVIRVLGDWLPFRTSLATSLLQAKITANVGFTEIPGPIKKACARLVWWSYKQRDTPPQGKTAIPSLGVLVIPDAWPNSAIALLQPYKNVRL